MNKQNNEEAPFSTGEDLASVGGAAATPPSNNGKLRFPEILHVLLQRAEDDVPRFNDVISWLPDGKSFRVHDPAAFERTVMPRFFQMTKYKSFVRQLNIWCFEMVEKSSREHPHHGGYTHQYLIRYRPEMCKLMKRVKIRGVYKRGQKSEETLPQRGPQLASNAGIIRLSTMFQDPNVHRHVSLPSNITSLGSHGALGGSASMMQNQGTGARSVVQDLLQGSQNRYQEAQSSRYVLPQHIGGPDFNNTAPISRNSDTLLDRFMLQLTNSSPDDNTLGSVTGEGGNGGQGIHHGGKLTPTMALDSEDMKYVMAGVKLGAQVCETMGIQDPDSHELPRSFLPPLQRDQGLETEEETTADKASSTDQRNLGNS